MKFADIKSSPQTIALLQRSLSAQRLSHAYLFCGGNLPELEQIARALIQTLFCESPLLDTETRSRIDNCGVCSQCKKIEAGKQSVVQWLRPESKLRIITVDQIRALLQSVSLTMANAPWKIAVIVATDRLNQQAANAFLKTLEEPPGETIFLLLTTSPQYVLETILSRCLRLNFGCDLQAPTSQEKEWLGEFALASAEPPTTGLLSRYGLLSRLTTQLGQIKQSVAEELAERSPLNNGQEVDSKIRERWEDQLNAAVEAEYRMRRGALLGSLQLFLRDVWLVSQISGKAILSFPDLEPQSAAIAKRITTSEALQNLEALERVQRLLGTNVQEALALEVALLKLKI